MKARWIIFRVLLLVLVVSPTSMRAMPRVMPVVPCQIAKSEIRTTYDKQRHRAPREVAYSLPGQHRPAPRLHRNRGKKISIERGLVALSGSSAPSRYIFSIVSAPLDGREGPNPPRGPPAQAL